MAHKNNPNRVKDTEITYVRQKNESHHNETTKKKDISQNPEFD